MLDARPKYRPPKDGESIDTLACFHCGDPCDINDIRIGDKYFCCNGCRTVYELLKERDLCSYYTLDEANRGRSPKDAVYSRRYAYLDDAEIERRIIDFSDADTRVATFRIPAMHCSSCIWLLERLNAIHDGIVSSRVNFPRKEVTVTWKASKLALSELVTLLASVGYEPYISLQSVAEKRRRDTDRKLYYKIGVAGFSFGNIMLFSFPEYLATDAGIDPVFEVFFRYINVLLALPVFFYSSLEYFQSAWSGLRRKLLNIDVPLSIGILMLFGRSMYDIFSHADAGYLDSFAGLVFFLLIGKVFQKKTYDALSFDRDFRSYFPLSVAVRENGHESTIPLTKLKIHDRIIVRNQELIPADAVLLRGEANIDYSFVTGEADLVQKKSGEHIHAGGRQIGQLIELEVVKDIEQSYLTRLWNNDVFTKEEHHGLTRLVDRISGRFTAAVLLIATSAALFWLWMDPSMVVTVFTAVLIIACPCALALSSPFALGSAQRVFGNNDFYIKNTETVEKLASIDTIVFDKTGTLTRNASTSIRFRDGVLSEEEQSMVKSLLRQSTHTLSRQVFASLNADVTMHVEDYRELPGQGIEGRILGRRTSIGAREWTGRESGGSEVSGATKVYVSIDGNPRGFFSVPNRYRPGLKEVVDALRADYEMVILSGDSANEETALRTLFGQDVPMHFNQSPVEKMEYIARLRRHGRRVLMLGDGLNDAGALKAADVGISLSEDINTFSPACDGILSASRFAIFDRLLHYSRSSVAVVKASFVLSLTYNVTGISFAVAGLLTPLVSAILMPLSSITVVAFTTLLTRWAAHKQGL